MLEAEGEVAETWRFSQRDIARNVDVATSRKVLDLALNEFGPYRTRFTRNGRHLLFGGARGHIALVNWQDYSVTSEWHVKETVRDVTPLHSFEMVAVAQRRHAYIYDSTGMEIHCLRSHLEPNRLEFLPYHWLLASVGRTGFLKYTDTSTGKLVVELRTKLGNCGVMCQNPHNAVIHLGHNNGVVTLWKPTMAKPLVTMMTHGAALTDCAVDLSGNYMVTTGLDSQMKVWDLRTYRRLHEYFTPTPATAVEISQRGLVAVSHGSQVQVWKDCFRRKAKAPYMRHQVGQIARHASAARGTAAARANLLGAKAGRSNCHISGLSFQPYEDVLAVGHATGISCMVVPGAGEPNYDAFEANPYVTTKQQREKDVHSLLDKLRPEMIMLNPDAGAFEWFTVVCGRRLPSQRRARRAQCCAHPSPLRRVRTLLLPPHPQHMRLLFLNCCTPLTAVPHRRISRSCLPSSSRNRYIAQWMGSGQWTVRQRKSFGGSALPRRRQTKRRRGQRSRRRRCAARTR